jgi:hypothetical protein
VRKKGLGLGFIGEYHAVEERESRRTAGLRSTGGADVLLGLAWRPLGTGGSTWRGEGKPAEAARAVGGASQRTCGMKESGTGLQRARESGRRRRSHGCGKEQRSPGMEEEDEDLCEIF